MTFQSFSSSVNEMVDLLKDLIHLHRLGDILVEVEIEEVLLVGDLYALTRQAGVALPTNEHLCAFDCITHILAM